MWSYICDATASRFINWFNTWNDTWFVRAQPKHKYQITLSPSLGLSSVNLVYTFEHYTIARQLLEKNDKVDSRSLILAASIGNLSAIRILLEAGFSVETRSDDITPLMAAAWAGEYFAVQQLLKAGAQMGATNSDGETALMIATKRGISQVVEVLLKANDRE